MRPFTQSEYEVYNRLQNELTERTKTAPTDESRRYIQGMLDGMNYAFYEKRKTE